MSFNISDQAKRIADQAYEILMKYDFNYSQYGIGSLLDADIPSISYQATRERAERAEAIYKEAAALLSEGVSHEDEMLLGVVQFNAGITMEEYQYYWNKFDYEPFFNAVNTYAGTITELALDNEDMVGVYARLVAAIARLGEGMLEKAKGHMERGILMAKPLVKISAGLFRSYAVEEAAKSQMHINPERIKAAVADEDGYVRAIDESIMRLSKAAKALAELFEGAYYEAAPEEIGLHQYPGGKEYYAACVKRHTTFDISPEEVFEAGRKFREAIEAEMADIRRKAGHDCSAEEFAKIIMNDPEWKMETPEEFGRRLNACRDKIAPLMDRYFGITIQTPCAAERVAPELEPYFANGVYEPAAPGVRDHGAYYYNGLNMSGKNPLKTESLAYHELMPGHHYQVSVVQESKELHNIVKCTLATSFLEGWAEYAAAFAGEIGLYNSVLSHYGRLEMDLYCTHFLTIETSVNAMDWTLKELEAFMAPYMPDFKGEALTRQLIRISQANPGFVLAYKFGSVKMQEFRREAEEKLGDKFDVREYHKIVVEWGDIPLYLLKKHIDWYVEQKLEG